MPRGLAARSEDAGGIFRGVQRAGGLRHDLGLPATIAARTDMARHTVASAGGLVAAVEDAADLDEAGLRLDEHLARLTQPPVLDVVEEVRRQRETVAQPLVLGSEIEPVQAVEPDAGITGLGHQFLP